jgi:hypothetical protein
MTEHLACMIAPAIITAFAVHAVLERFVITPYQELCRNLLAENRRLRDEANQPREDDE